MIVNGNLALKQDNFYMLSEQTTQKIEPVNIVTNDAGGPIIFDAVLQDLDPNRNGRRYEDSALKPALTADHIDELIREGNWGGECGHPIETKQGRQGTIMPDRVSHFITKTWWVGNKLWGRIKTAPGKYGDLMKAYIKNGHNIAFSLRAMGTIKREGGLKVVTAPMRVITYDWVILPSHMQAYRDKNSGVYEVRENYQLDDNQLYLTESFEIKIDDKESESIIKENGEALNIMKDMYSQIYESVSYDDKNNMLKVGRDGEKMTVHLENYLERSIDTFFLNR